MTLDSVFIALSLVLIIATVLPFIRSDEWWIRLFDFPRTQIAVGGLVTAGLFFLIGTPDSIADASILVLLTLCVLYQGYRIYPYTPLAAQQVRGSTRQHPPACLSLLISNVRWDNRQVERYLAIVRKADPDLLLAVETNQWWVTQLRALDDTYPYAVKYPQENKYGMLLYSRLTLLKPEVKFLVEENIPSIHAQVELPIGVRIALSCLHPRPPYPYKDQDTTQRDAELLVVGRALAQTDTPALVAGDLNDVAWSHTTTLFQKVSRLLDPRRGRGMYNTFNAKNPLFRWPLDHVFHSRHFTLVKLERLPFFGSDHFPIYVELSYEPEAGAQHPTPVADPEEQEEAQKDIEQVKG